MADQDPNEVQPVVYDEFLQDILDGGDFETCPELREALKFSDTMITPNLTEDEKAFDPELSNTQRRAALYIRRVLRAVRRLDPERFNKL